MFQRLKVSVISKSTLAQFSSGVASGHGPQWSPHQEYYDCLWHHLEIYLFGLTRPLIDKIGIKVFKSEDPMTWIADQLCKMSHSFHFHLFTSGLSKMMNRFDSFIAAFANLAYCFITSATKIVSIVYNVAIPVALTPWLMVYSATIDFSQCLRAISMRSVSTLTTSLTLTSCSIAFIQCLENGDFHVSYIFVAVARTRHACKLIPTLFMRFQVEIP